jgi:VWFA-related protein
MNKPALGLSLLAAFAVASVAAQDRPPAGLQSVVDVGLKLVQVFVTDRAGRPVTDLRAEDFTVFDNGIPQPVTAFEVHSRSLPVAAEAEPRAADAPPESGRVFLFLFDYYMNDPSGIARSKAIALEFLNKKAQPADRFGIMSYFAVEGFEILLDPTADHPRVRKILTEMKGVPRLKSSDEVYRMSGRPAAEKQTIFQEACLYCRSLEDLALALQEIEGFKNVLFFSRGLSTDVFFGGDLNDPENAYGLSVFERYQSALDAMAQSLSPFFAINTQGSRGRITRDPWSSRGVDALVGISKATGGIYYPTPDFPAAVSEKIDLTTANYYVLGYRLDPGWHGRFHELKVEVNRPGCEIRMPRGYFNPKSYSDFSLGEKHGQLMDLARGKESPFLIPLKIPTAALPLAPSADFADANCLILCDIGRPELRDLAGSGSEVALFVFDEYGEMFGVRMARISLTDRKAECLVPYFTEAVPPGRYEAGVVLRNLDTGMAAVGRTSFVIPGPRKEDAGSGDETSFGLDPLLLLRQGTGTDFFKLSGTSGKAGRSSLDAFYPFVSVKTEPVLGILKSEPEPLQAVVRVHFQSLDSDPDLAWSAAFIPTSTGTEISMNVEDIVSQEVTGATAYLLSLDRPRLPQGDGILRLSVVWRKNGRTAAIEIPLLIR